MRIDGLAAKYDEEYVVVLNPTVSNDRGRLNAAHELAHILFGDCDMTVRKSRRAERRAFDFASHFLLPNNQLKKAFIGKSMVRLVQFLLSGLARPWRRWSTADKARLHHQVRSKMVVD